MPGSINQTPWPEESLGVAIPFTPAKLVIPTLLSHDADRSVVAASIREAFGEIDYESAEIPFTFTDYYTPEMGHGIRRFFVSLAELWDPSRLAEVKLRTDEIEACFARGAGGRRGNGGTGRRPAGGPGSALAGRTVNLDPGMLTLGRLILASTKDNAQRIPLRDGIYAEITLLYRKGDFVPLPWTYPDYRSEAYRAVLGEIRTLYKAQLEAAGSVPP
jgi:hypothetical protein